LEVVVGNFGGGLQLYNASIPVNNLGLSEQMEDHQIMIFPNPVTSQLQITAAQVLARVVVMDWSGRKLLDVKPMGTTASLEVSSLAPGVYLLVLELERGSVNRIFLKR
jgi:hypothetical protein